MRTSKSMTAFITSLALLSQGSGITQLSFAGPVGSAAGGFSVPISNPAMLNLQGPMANIQRKIQACQMSAMGNSSAVKDGLDKLGDLITKNKSKTATGAKKKGSGKTCYEAIKSKTEFACDMTCKEPSPSKLAEPACGTYYQKKEAYEDGTLGAKKRHNDWVPREKSTFDADKDEINTFQLFTSFKVSCPSEDAEEMKKKLAAYNCAVDALQGATSEASTLLQSALQQNTAQYGKMMQFQQEIGDQVRQVDEVLGPDKDIGGVGGNQFQGLLGMQKALNAEMPKMIEAETAFKTQSEQVQKDLDASEQTLDADRMGQVVDCMKGNRNLGVSGGRSLTCFKPAVKTSNDASGKPVSTPVTDASGNIVYSKQACGALEYVRSQVEQSAYISARGVIRSQARTEQAQQNTAAFDSMMDSMIRDMGGYDAATGEGKLVGRNTNWADLSKKYSGDMADISAKTGINMQAQMGSVAGSCYKSGEQWRVQQKRSASSDYSKRTKATSDNKAKLAAQLNAGLGDLNKNYGEIIAVLGKQSVAIDRTKCTTNDTSKMQQCYSDMRKQVNNLLEGNGVSVTTKTFSGGALVGGFVVPCKGINGCVTALQQVRTQKKEQNATAQKAKVDFVNKGNAAIQQQLTQFAQRLSQIQQSVAAQFNGLKQMLLDKKIKAPGNLKYMEAEPLAGEETVDKSPGPFKGPKSMAAVLSGMVQPTGLLNFQETGIDALTDAAVDKADKDAASAKEKAEKFAGILTKYNELDAKCTDANVGSSDSGVGVMASGQGCPSLLRGYEYIKASEAKPDVMNRMLMALGEALAPASIDKGANESVKTAGQTVNELEAKVKDCRTDNTTKVVAREKENSGTPDNVVRAK